MRDKAKFALAVDSVINPATGLAACRVNTDASTANDAPGCVPLNPFGAGSVSQAAMGYYLGTSWEEDDIQEDVAGITIRGTPFTLPAGDVGFAAGVEARRDEIDRLGDPLSQTNGWRTSNFGSFAGEVKVKEAFGELAIPLLADMPFVNKLDVNFAGRVTDYSTSGTVKTWKAGANYEPVDWLRFRGTISRDIRAPTIYETFRPSGIQTFVTVIDPLLGSSVQAPQITGGNLNLAPEVAKTHTVGVVFTPDFIPGLRASVDYYKINIRDVIATLTPQQTVDQCYVSKNLEYCDLITRSAAGTIASISGQDINAASLRTAGVDTEVQYRFPLENLAPVAGDVTLRLLATYTQYRITTASGVKTDIAGQNNGGIPTWKINASAAYANGPFMFRTTARFVSAGKYNKTLEEGVRIEDNSLPSATYIDLAASYQINENFQVYGAVNNLFNKAPPVSPNAIVEVQYNASGNYDTIGRWATVGVRFNF
jgi:outer membrane receptor protein involved in Fe transport